MHYLIQKMLVEVVLDIHIRGVKIKKKFFDLDVVIMYFLKKKEGSWRIILPNLKHK